MFLTAAEQKLLKFWEILWNFWWLQGCIHYFRFHKSWTVYLLLFFSRFFKGSPKIISGYFSIYYFYSQTQNKQQVRWKENGICEKKKSWNHLISRSHMKKKSTLALKFSFSEKASKICGLLRQTGLYHYYCFVCLLLCTLTAFNLLHEENKICERLWTSFGGVETSCMLYFTY